MHNKSPLDYHNKIISTEFPVKILSPWLKAVLSNVHNFFRCVSYNISALVNMKTHSTPSVGIATDYGLDGPGSNTSGEGFSARPDWLWGPPSLL